MLPIIRSSLFLLLSGFFLPCQAQEAPVPVENPAEPVEVDEVTVADDAFAWSAFVKEAREKYMKQRLFREKAAKGYREALAEIVQQATEVHVFRLDPDLEAYKEEELPLDKRFPINPYGTPAKILEVKVLGDAESQAFVEALAAGLQEHEKGGGAKCHLPVYGVRIYRKDELPFQSSFCWECENYYIDYPDHSSWQAMGPEFEALKALFQKAIPLPAEN